MMHLIKFVFVFVLGAAIALFVARWALNSYNPNVLSAQSDTKDIVTGFLYDNILPQIAKSPALAPFFETKRSVEESVSAVSTLPEAQKAAVCQELCGEAIQQKPGARTR